MSACQEIDVYTVAPVFRCGHWWWIWRRMADGVQIHAGINEEQLVCGAIYRFRHGKWERKV